MIPNKEKEGWHYLAAKKLSALLHGITSKYKGEFYCLNHLHSFRTENKLKSYKKVRENKYFCWVVMPSEIDSILEFNQHIKSNKVPHFIYVDMEFNLKNR